jgi:tRNA G46 methylase TrmB
MLAAYLAAVCWTFATALRPTRVQNIDVGALLQQRTLLRQQKAFVEADALLDRAKQFGAIVRDHANGTSTYTLRRRAVDAPSVLSLAKAARDYAGRGDLSDGDVAEYVAARAEEAREALAEPDAAPGRQASDAAFAFALAGCRDDELLDGLLDRHASNRAKRRTVNDLQAEERLGACGLRGRDAFFAPRACQWRWRYARDARTTPAADVLSVAFPPGPLVLDLGCGMGGSAIGLALNSEANVLAVDTSRACVRAARGFAKRLGSSCRFVVADAADALRWAATHEGPVYVLVQFPTPFALGGEATVRERRPFLLSRDVAELVTSAIGTEGAVYVASQVEDVALASADALESAGLCLEPAEEPVMTEAPKRLRDERVGSERRAVGGPWRATSPLPADAAPESERRCELLGQPVHRFVASRRRRGDRLRLFAAPRDDLDGGDDDADVVLDAALTRVMHAGTYEFVEDTSEPNRVFLGADGRATALRDIYDDSSGAGRGGAQDGRWRVERIRNNSTHCKIHLSLGRYNLQGSVSSRGGDAVEGVVLEGASDPDFVGRFRLALTSRAANDSAVDAALEKAATKRATRPAPPARVGKGALAGRQWLLSATVDDEQCFFILDFMESGEFVDTAGADAPCEIGGRWGVYDEGVRDPPRDGRGSHVWIWIRRSKCRGASGLHGDLRLHGRIEYDDPLAELALRSGVDRPPDRATGPVLFGDIPDMEYSALVGSFVLTPSASLPDELRRRLPVGGMAWS